MTDTSDEKRDFFVSFNQADRHWATWIAWVLEEKGYSVFFQDWDLRGSFIEQMHQASLRTGRTLVVLSDHYLHSEYTRSEAWAALACDPVGREDRVVTVKVGPTTGNLGLFSHFAYVDLTTSAEADAECLILERARKAVEPDYRAKPSTRPDFPGEATRKVPEKPSFPGVIHNLPLTNPDFVGREEFLAKLHRLLTNNRGPAVLSEAIAGLGGIGKTQTALVYCYRHLADYTLVWWLRAGTRAALAADFTTLADPLGIDSAAADQDKIASISSALQARERWLLVFDNVEEPKLPRDFLPATGKGHVLITSRRTDWQGIAKALELEEMMESEALELLAGRTDPGALPIAELEEAKALAKDLGFLPLALAQARAYLAETGESFGGYRALLRTSGPELLGERHASLDYPEPVARTWDISLRAAEQQHQAARPLLELLAFFAPDPLPREALDTNPEALPQDMRDKLERNRAIAALHRFSLIRAQAGTLTVHRLVQAVTFAQLSDPLTLANAAISLIDAAFPAPCIEVTCWPQCSQLSPHAEAALKAVTDQKFSLGTDVGSIRCLISRISRLLDRLTPYLYAVGSFNTAESLLRRAVDQRNLIAQTKSFHAEDLCEDLEFAHCLTHLAVLYHAKGRYYKAKTLCEQSLAILECKLKLEDPDIAATLHYLARIERNIGQIKADVHYAKAESLFKRALEIRQALGPQSSTVADTLNSMAALYRYQGRFVEAESLVKRALEIRRSLFHPEHPEIAHCLNHLGLTYFGMGRYSDAELAFKQAIGIREALPQKDNYEVGTTLHDLAELYRAQSQFEKAKPLYERALAIREKVLGDEHELTQKTRRALGVCL